MLMRNQGRKRAKERLTAKAASLTTSNPEMLRCVLSRARTGIRAYTRSFSLLSLFFQILKQRDSNQAIPLNLFLLCEPCLLHRRYMDCLCQRHPNLSLRSPKRNRLATRSHEQSNAASRKARASERRSCSRCTSPSHRSSSAFRRYRKCRSA